MTEQEIAARAIVETMRYLAKSGTTGDPDPDAHLIWWADTVEQGAILCRTSFICCPFCAEVECDDDCPLRHWPRGTYGWSNIPNDAHDVTFHPGGTVTYRAPWEDPDPDGD